MPETKFISWPHTDGRVTEMNAYEAIQTVDRLCRWLGIAPPPDLHSLVLIPDKPYVFNVAEDTRRLKEQNTQEIERQAKAMLQHAVIKMPPDQ